MHNKTLEALSINQINKAFMTQDNQDVSVFEDLSFNAKQGEIISIVGPSGCGKSTLLNIIGGFEKINKGEVLYHNNPITGPSSDRGMVFQTAALFPWLNVKQNIEYGLKIKKVDKNIREKQVKKYIQHIGLKGFEEFYLSQLSGGMQQRVALARILIMEPRLLLLDEPFAALDYHTRLEMQGLLMKMWDTFRPTVIFVTHDIEAAVFISDRILIMSKRAKKIVSEFRIPFNRSRDIALIKDLKFNQIKSDILTFFLGLTTILL